MRYNTA